MAPVNLDLLIKILSRSTFDKGLQLKTLLI
ncbi:hypothetical protein COLO4_35404 [Corchorus olitorius]|uniref:Uncharacterized protein n=1 Tax=Corchorus olitorius TaxID=93759 RepID=A0A1R3GH96_9ROSI|nr:hypothetical protein COLO4_35404 [Corchorus olitorius]